MSLLKGPLNTNQFPCMYCLLRKSTKLREFKEGQRDVGIKKISGKGEVMANQW